MNVFNIHVPKMMKCGRAFYISPSNGLNFQLRLGNYFIFVREILNVKNKS